MRQALELAARGLGRTAPNPAVGAVVVSEGVIVGESYHHRAGEPHAEPLALIAAGEKACGADLYVSLEPCCHQGRTPPCTEAIIAAGIARVFYACGDPDVRVAGEGAARLTAAGIDTHLGPLTQEALALNEAYFKHKQTGLPFVTLKLAMTLDGKIATNTGDSRWITGEASRRRVHELRNRNDAVMVGLGTVLKDDPELTCRLDAEDVRDPVRVVLDSTARTPTTARVVTGSAAKGADTRGGGIGGHATGGDALGADTGGGGSKCIIAASESAPVERVERLEAAGAEVLRLPGDPGTDGHGGGGGVDLLALLRALGERGMMSVLCEGGSVVAARLLKARAVDRLLCFYAPKIVGGSAAVPAVGELGIHQMSEALGLSLSSVERIDEDVLMTLHPSK